MRVPQEVVHSFRTVRVGERLVHRVSGPEPGGDRFEERLRDGRPFRGCRCFGVGVGVVAVVFAEDVGVGCGGEQVRCDVRRVVERRCGTSLWGGRFAADVEGRVPPAETFPHDVGVGDGHLERCDVVAGERRARCEFRSDRFDSGGHRGVLGGVEVRDEFRQVALVACGRSPVEPGFRPHVAADGPDARVGESEEFDAVDSGPVVRGELLREEL